MYARRVTRFFGCLSIQTYPELDIQDQEEISYFQLHQAKYSAGLLHDEKLRDSLENMKKKKEAGLLDEEDRLPVVFPSVIPNGVQEFLSKKVHAYLRKRVEFALEPLSENLILDILILIYIKDAYAAGVVAKSPFSYAMINAIVRAHDSKRLVREWLLCGEDDVLCTSRRSTSPRCNVRGWKGWTALFVGIGLLVVSTFPYSTYLPSLDLWAFGIGISCAIALISIYNGILSMVLTGILGHHESVRATEERDQIEQYKKIYTDAAKRLIHLCLSDNTQARELGGFLLPTRDTLHRLKEDFKLMTTEKEKTEDMFSTLEEAVNYIGESEISKDSFVFHTEIEGTVALSLGRRMFARHVGVGSSGDAVVDAETNPMVLIDVSSPTVS